MYIITSAVFNSYYAISEGAQRTRFWQLYWTVCMVVLDYWYHLSLIAKDIGMTIRKSIVVSFLPCLVGFLAYYMFFHFFQMFFCYFLKRDANRQR